MKRVVISVVLAALATASAPALASGSGSGGGAGFGGVGSPFPIQSEEDRLQQRGRSQVKSRIACKSCEYKDGVTKQNAGEVAQAVRGGRFELAEKDRVAVLFYLRQRFGV